MTGDASALPALTAQLDNPIPLVRELVARAREQLTGRIAPTLQK